MYTLIFFFTCPETTYNRPTHLDIDIREELDDRTSTSSDDGNSEAGSKNVQVGVQEKTVGDSESKTSRDAEAASTEAAPETKITYWQSLRVYNGRFSDESLLRTLVTPWSAFMLPAVS